MRGSESPVATPKVKAEVRTESVSRGVKRRCEQAVERFEVCGIAEHAQVRGEHAAVLGRPPIHSALECRDVVGRRCELLLGARRRGRPILLRPLPG